MTRVGEQAQMGEQGLMREAPAELAASPRPTLVAGCAASAHQHHDDDDTVDR